MAKVRNSLAAGTALMTDWVVGGSGPTDFQLLSLWTQNIPWSTASIFFNTDVAPLRPGPGGLVLTVLDTQGNTLSRTVTDTASGQTRTWQWTYNAQGQLASVAAVETTA